MRQKINVDDFGEEVSWIRLCVRPWALHFCFRWPQSYLPRRRWRSFRGGITWLSSSSLIS